MLRFESGIDSVFHLSLILLKNMNGDFEDCGDYADYGDESQEQVATWSLLKGTLLIHRTSERSSCSE